MNEKKEEKELRNFILNFQSFELSFDFKDFLNVPW